MVNNKEFTKRLARKLNVTQDVADEIIKGMQELIFDLLDEDPKVKIGDFLVLEKKEVKERVYTLPNSNEKGIKEAHYKLTAKFTEKYYKQPK